MNNRLKNAKAKFQVTNWTSGPRRAGLMKKSLKLLALSDGDKTRSQLLRRQMM